ncbi:hypothetical protein KAJ87_01620 [Candidatus Pacearchaeota archaeon]|nr:hypothetical protein [Candidatus Pacearchaeota archaeon]
MKTWKIILLIITVLIILFIGFIFYNGYQYSKFYDEAESMGSVRFGSELFNKKLQSCDLTYADTWEIRGLENDLCVVSFNWDNDVNYDEGIIIHNWIACSLPYEIYSNADRIEWSELVGSIYCR